MYYDTIIPEVQPQMKQNTKQRKTIITTTICILTLIALITTIQNYGPSNKFAKADTVIGIGVEVYWDQNCTNTTQTLKWGPIAPNTTNTLTIYIRNAGNQAASLQLGTANWTPTNAQNYLTLNWNYTNQTLKPNQVQAVKLTLTVSPTITDVTDFSLQTIITTIVEP